MKDKTHKPDGSDAAGSGLVITIRIGCDGLVYFQDVTAQLAPVVISLRPHDARLEQRVQAATTMRAEG